MSHYEERLEHDINLIRTKIADLADRVETMITDGVRGLLTEDRQLSYKTIMEDNIVNRGNEEVMKHCYAFIARHLPSAGHLRRVSSILHVCVDLERIGDQAVAISRVAVQLSKSLDDNMKRHAERLVEESTHMLNQAVKAFNDDNVELARATMALDSQVDHSFQNAFYDLAKEENKEKWPVRDMLGLLAIFYSLERVSDLAKNICEKTVFSITGQAKQRKQVKVLFLDNGDDYLSIMAEAIGNKLFSKWGVFSSGCRKENQERDTGFLQFMDNNGLEHETIHPTLIEKLPRLDEFTILISLNGPVDKYVSLIPFNVIVLEWDIGPHTSEIADNEKEEQFRQAYRTLFNKTYELMEIMRGEEAVSDAN